MPSKCYGAPAPVTGEKRALVIERRVVKRVAPEYFDGIIAVDVTAYAGRIGDS